MNPVTLPYQRCLISNIPEGVQHTVRDVTNLVVVPLDMLLAFLSIISNLLVLTALLRTRSLQHPSLLLLCSLSISDVLWAIFSIVKDTRRFTFKHFCPGGLGGLGARTVRSNPAMDVLKWPTLEERRRKSVFKLVKKCLQGKCPQYFKEYFKRNNTIHAGATRQSNLLHPPAVRTEIAKRSFYYYGCTLFNELS